MDFVTYKSVDVFAQRRVRRLLHKLLLFAAALLPAVATQLSCLDAAPFVEPCQPVSGRRQVCRYNLSPTVDGILESDVWGSEHVHWEQVHSNMGSEPADDDMDASYRFACVADSENLYFAFDVTDDVFKIYKKECMSHKGDSLEIYIDQDTQNPDQYNGNDAQIIIRANSEDVDDDTIALDDSCDNV